MPEQVGVGEFLPPYYISQLGDSLIISGSFEFGNFRIIYAWALEFEDCIISSSNLLFTIPHPAAHFLKLLGFSNANEPIVEAEIVQQCYSSEASSPNSYSSGSTTPQNHQSGTSISGGCSNCKHLLGKIKVLKAAVGLHMHPEQHTPWVSATNYVNTFGGTVTGCLGDVNNFLKNGKLKLVVGIVKSCSPNMLGDLNVTMKDLSGTIPGTIHHKVIGKGGYRKDITVGAAMILTNVFVFSPTPSKHYLIITMRNLVDIFCKDTVLGNDSG
nr:hypothetical protein [Tanacetum cinerariifolium]